MSKHSSDRRGRNTTLRKLRRLTIGEAGWGPALVVAGVAVVVAFISIAGARLLVSADNTATRQAIGQVPVLDAGIDVSANPSATPVGGVLSAADIARIGRLLLAGLPRRQDFRLGQSWSGVLMPTAAVANPAPSAVATGGPSIEVAYRTALASRCVVVAGSLPGAAGPIRSGVNGAGLVTLRVAVTQATAARFRLRVGSVMDLDPATTGDPDVALQVTGIVRPKAPGSSFWQAVNSLRAPVLEPLPNAPFPDATFWLGGALVGPRELNALSAAYPTSAELATWFMPIRTSLTAAEVPKLESAMASFAVSPITVNAETRVTGGELAGTVVTAGLAQALSAFTAQWHSVATTDSLLLVGLFVAGAMLLFICSELAIESYRSELVLLRVRGGSLRQLARRMLARSCLLAVLALAAGSALAVAVLPGSGDTTSWVLGGLTALVAITGLPVLAVLAHRERRLADLHRRDELVVGRPRLRRLVAELAIVVVCVAAIADLRLRGSGTASTTSYLSASAVLVAAVVGLVVNRAYRGPLRAAAKVAGVMKGPVGMVGLTRAALARTGSVAPALVLMLTLTLVAFTGMIVSAISTGQVAASWAQVGADVEVSAPGLTGVRLTGVTASQLHALGRVSGVRHTTVVYTALSTSVLAAEVTTAGRTSRAVGFAVVRPASYAALAADTPWPDFPQAALARPRSGPSGVVPVLVTPDVRAAAQASAEAAGAGSGGSTLDYGGLSLPIKIIGTVTDTPAMPAGGSYVVLPQWATYRLPAIPQANTVLLTGSTISIAELQATVARVFPPGTTVTLRRQVLTGLVDSPALRLSSRIYIAGAIAAAVLTVLAVLFALASSARSRAAMMNELAALGMARKQALALGLTDALPLLAVAAIGSAISGWLLAVILRPVLSLGVFTDGTFPVRLEPTWPAVLIPIAAAAAIAIVFLMLEGLAGGRRHIGTLLRIAEASQT
jgi:putative ABC transport system permease protein